MTKMEIFNIIESERKYQDSKWGHTLSDDRPGDGSRSVDEFALYISGYAAVLVHAASTTGTPNSKLEVVRKIAALCVACMEQHGCPQRM